MTVATGSSRHGDGGARCRWEEQHRGLERTQRWGEWTRRALGRLQARLGGSGGVRGDQGVVAVLGWLGGIPPSSLDARGEEDDRGRGGWAGWWAFAWATGKVFFFSV